MALQDLLIACSISEMTRFDGRVGVPSTPAQELEHLDTAGSCPSARYHLLTAAHSHSVGTLPFSLAANTTGLSVWVCLGGSCLRGKREMQPWHTRLAILHHPRDSSRAREPLSNYLRSDCKLDPLQGLSCTLSAHRGSRCCAVLGTNSRKSRNSLGDLTWTGRFKLSKTNFGLQISDE